MENNETSTQETTALETIKTADVPVHVEFQGSIYNTPAVFEHAQRVAKVFAASKLVPETYRGNIADCLIALEMANRMQVNPMMFMQNTSIIKGKPSIDGKFAIALLNSRSPYANGVQFKYEGSGDTRKCTAFGTHKNTGEIHEASMSVAEAKQWGWWDKTDSAWKKMTDQMLAYRSAAFLIRRYCPELLLGLHMKEEVQDFIDVTPKESSFNSKLKAIKPEATNA